MLAAQLLVLHEPGRAVDVQPDQLLGEVDHHEPDVRVLGMLPRLAMTPLPRYSGYARVVVDAPEEAGRARAQTCCRTPRARPRWRRRPSPAADELDHRRLSGQHLRRRTGPHDPRCRTRSEGVVLPRYRSGPSAFPATSRHWSAGSTRLELMSPSPTPRKWECPGLLVARPLILSRVGVRRGVRWCGRGPPERRRSTPSVPARGGSVFSSGRGGDCESETIHSIGEVLLSSRTAGSP